MDIFVDDFITSRDDCSDAVMRAIESARSLNEGCTIIFSSGTYKFKTAFTFSTDSIAHDDGCGRGMEKSAYILIKGINNLTLRGASDSDGEPLTVLEGADEGKTQSLQTSLIWAEDSENLKIENLIFSRSLRSNFVATVLSVENGLVTLSNEMGLEDEILPLYCLNRFQNGRLIGRSLTMGFCVDKNVYLKDGKYVIEDEEIARELKAGDHIAWRRSGLTDFMLFFSLCDCLMLSNIRIEDTSGFGILTECSKNIKGDRVVIKPSSGYLTATSRDGWKIFRCSGIVEIKESHFEGTRMDAQNIHSSYMRVVDFKDNKIIAEMKYAPSSVAEGSVMTIEGKDGSAVVLSSEVIKSEYRKVFQSRNEDSAIARVGTENRYNTYLLVVDKIPQDLEIGDLLNLSCFTVRKYVVRNTKFKNIAGCGLLIRSQEALVDSCTFENTMYPGVLIGAEKDTHEEGVISSSVEIRNSVFISSGGTARYGSKAKAAISSVSEGFDLDGAKKIRIEGNTFISCPDAFEIENGSNVHILNNLFKEKGYEKESLA